MVESGVSHAQPVAAWLPAASATALGRRLRLGAEQGTTPPRAATNLARGGPTGDGRSQSGAGSTDGGCG